MRFPAVRNVSGLLSGYTPALNNLYTLHLIYCTRVAAFEKVKEIVAQRIKAAE